MENEGIEFSTRVVRYDSEHSAYPTIAKEEVKDHNVQFVVDKLAKHFKLGKLWCSFYGYRISRAYRNRAKIRFRHNPDFVTIGHEVNHFLSWKLERTKGFERIRHGTKRWNRGLNKILKYCVKKNFWKEEIERMNNPKVKVVVEPTLEEKKLLVIENLNAKIKRYNSKMKFYSTKLKKAQRKLNRINKK